MKSRVSFVAALLAVMMLGIGACCCGGAILAAEVNAPEDACCAGKSAPPAHKDDCRCSGQVLIDAKQAAPSTAAPALPVSYISGALNASLCRFPGPDYVPARKAFAMERPPPREIRRWLGIWMV